MEGLSEQGLLGKFTPIFFRSKKVKSISSNQPGRFPCMRKFQSKDTQHATPL